MEFQLSDLLHFWPIALGIGLMLLPVRSRWWGAAIVAILLAAATLGLGSKGWFGLGSPWVNPYTVRIEAFICITAIMAVSLNLINGITGLFSIGHAGFMVVGAYTAGIMTGLLFRLTDETGLGLALPAKKYCGRFSRITRFIMKWSVLSMMIPSSRGGPSTGFLFWDIWMICIGLSRAKTLMRFSFHRKAPWFRHFWRRHLS
jgi:ABC-type branched-subunit amino acid transport system permease subunit